MDRQLPNMGRYHCFLGQAETCAPNYFTHPVFIYFQSFLIIIQIVNTFFLITTSIQMRWAILFNYYISIQ